MIPERSSGVLAHITSLPSPYGIGDLHDSSFNFINFLAKSEQSYWQILPTVPTQEIFDHSPYMSNSAFAGNPLFISPQGMLEDGFLNQDDIANHPLFSPYSVQFKTVVPWKKELMEKAATNFFSNEGLQQKWAEEYKIFKKKSPWLQDYALFMTAKEIFDNTSWNTWPKDIVNRNKKALEVFALEYENRIRFYLSEQFIFHLQWKKMKALAEEKGVRIFGDIPIYVSYDSVDVWVNPNLFALDKTTLKPTHVAGVPPDYFSETGQRWGNPLYDWQNKSPAIRKKLYDWWAERLKHTFEMVDVTRIDHFRGFESYWSIPEENETAEYGEWLPGPGIRFFEAMKKRIDKMNIVAEDLGVITDEVRKLRNQTGFPGMKILLFAFDANTENAFLPHNYESVNCVVYTGTHDNNTVVGWYFNEKRKDEERRQLKSYVNGYLEDNKQVHKDLIFLAHSSIARLSIIPLQDILGFGDDCRMNVPGKAEGNWRWQCPAENFSAETSSFLREITLRFNRGKKQQDSDKE